MKDVCKSCVLYFSPFHCCYHEFLLTQRECNFRKCFFTKYCPHVNLESFKTKERRLIEILKDTAKGVFRTAATSLPSSFIPEVMPMKKDRQEAMSIVRDMEIPIIAVSLQNFFRGTRETSLLRKARRLGLHNFFDYSGEIILTTDVKNRLCDKFLENTGYFRVLVEKLKPEYLTTFDTYTYSNIPACISRIKMLKAISSSYELLNLDCKIIGLALGATPDQVYSHVQTLIQLGCKIVAHPVYEFRKDADTYSIRWRVLLSKRLQEKVLLLSCSPGLTARMRVYANYYSSWSWFSSVSSKDKNAYRKRKAKLSRMITLGKKYSRQTRL